MRGYSSPGRGYAPSVYGFTAVLLGALLAERGFSGLAAGAVLTALIAGTALASLAVGRFGDRFGRRRSYAVFFCGIAAAGVVVAVGAPFWVLLVVALTGTLSTDVVDNGPATTLEQAMLATEDAGSAAVYGRYNAVGSAAGALGALGVALPWLGPGSAARGVHGWLFLVLVPAGIAGAVIAARLSPAVEASAAGTSPLEPVTKARSQLGPSRPAVRRLAGLFAVDAAGGGLVTTGFLSYYFAERYHTSVIALGWLFFAVSVVQAVSVALAPLLARRFGLIATMVGTHLPSNLLLAAVAFAPTFPAAAALLLARTTLSQMDVPTRQALVMTGQVLDEAQRQDAISFDAPGARYDHRDGKCTFEVLLDEYDLTSDPALMRLAKIVHAADIAADIGTDPAGPGLLAIGLGGLDVEADDHRLLERGRFVYDALYAWCQRQVPAPA